MKPTRRIAALAASTALLWGSAHAAPETPEPVQETPVIILELQPLPPGVAGTAGEEQALLSMLMLQLLMSGAQIESAGPESPGAAAVVTPKAGEHRI